MSSVFSVGDDVKELVEETISKCDLKEISEIRCIPINELYERKIYFYEAVFQAYLKFLQSRNDKDSFRNVPKCYASSSKSKIIALENLKDKGFTLHVRRTVMDDTHIDFVVLKTFAKFHAVSFAFKTQENEMYEKILEGSREDLVCKMFEVEGVGKLIVHGISSFINELDPIEDTFIVEKCD